MTMNAMILCDLNSNLQASSYDDSIESLHAVSRCNLVIKAPASYFISGNINEKNDKFNITMHYSYVRYENNLRPQSHCKKLASKTN